MYIPTHYVILFVAILLSESAALFIYTIIGLIKQNPLPYLYPPEMGPPPQQQQQQIQASYPMCPCYAAPPAPAPNVYGFNGVHAPQHAVHMTQTATLPGGFSATPSTSSTTSSSSLTSSSLITSSTTSSKPTSTSTSTTTSTTSSQGLVGDLIGDLSETKTDKGNVVTLPTQVTVFSTKVQPEHTAITRVTVFTKL